MLKSFKTGAVRLLYILNAIVVLAMLVSGHADLMRPTVWPLLANSGLVFPFLLAANLCFLVLWLVVYWRGAWLPVAACLLCFSPVRRYFPLNAPSHPPQGAIKVLSYNVLMFAPWNLAPEESNPIVDYICQSQADIVCLQEAYTAEAGGRKVEDILRQHYPYADIAMRPGAECNNLALYSKFPIKQKHIIDYPSAGNLSVAYTIDLHGEDVVVINNHLETNALSMEDKSRFKDIVKGHLSEKAAKRESRRLLAKLNKASIKRAPQAEAVAKYIRTCRKKGKSVIVCGDFNDNPVSYARRTIGRGLTDCYVATANGPGFSFHKHGMFVRIDNIFCSDDWQPYKATVDPSVTTSDHYPISCWLMKKEAKR